MSVLTSKQEKRLEKLQKEGQIEFGDGTPSEITTPDLLLLLRHDPEVKKLIHRIVCEALDSLKQCSSGGLGAELVDTPELDNVVNPITENPEPHEFIHQPNDDNHVIEVTSTDTLRANLAVPLDLLSVIETDPDLCYQWLGELSDNEGDNLLKLVVNAANWDRIEELWDLLAARCKKNQQVANAQMQSLLQGCVSLHNMLWQDRAASLSTITVGASFDFKLHERGTPNGETIRELWLPGLKNAAGNERKKILVATI